MRLRVHTGILIPSVLFLFSLLGLQQASAQSNGYSYRRAITIDHTKVPNTDQTNFPLLISGTYSYLATTANGGNVTNATGYDVIFTSDSAGANTLPFEQESYSASTGQIVYWVKVSTLSHTADTVVYMFYGNSSVSTDQSNKHGVWDSNFKGVWHMANGTTFSSSDSSSNGYNFSNTVDYTSGKIGGAASLNGSDYLSNSSLSISPGSSITVSFWNLVSAQASSSFTIGGSDNPNRIAASVPWSDSNLYWDYGSWSGGGRLSTSYSSYLSSWTHVVLEYDAGSTTHYIYLNGSLANSNVNSNAPTSTQTGIDVGAWPPYYESGSIDEFRVSTVARSADWVATEYNNQGSPSTFYSVGVATASPSLLSLSRTSAGIGDSITISGSNFGSTIGSASVTFNGTTSSPTSWSANSIATSVPSGATTGNVVVTVSGIASNGLSLTIVSGGISGTVSRASDGSAVSGATVAMLQGGIQKATLTTASDGTYSIGLTAGTYDIAFSKAGLGTTVQTGISVSSSGHSSVNASLVSPGTISGQVTQAGSGINPVAGATITVSFHGDVVGTTTTNTSGNYTVSGLGSTSFTVQAAAIGFATSTQDGVNVTSGNTTTQNFSLPSGIVYVYDQLGRLVGVVDPAGNAAAYSYDPVGNLLAISRKTASQASVLQFTPTSGPVGTMVSIYGTGFSSSLTGNTVTFNGVSAVITSATAAHIITSVPSGASTGSITLTTPLGSFTPSTQFTVTATSGAPSISSFSPGTATAGTSISIMGTNFNTNVTYDYLLFNTTSQYQASATSTNISTTVPAAAASGLISVQTPNGKAVSSQDLYVPFGTHVASDVGYTNRTTLGSTVTLSIGTSNQIGLLLFDATAGQKLTLSLSSGSFASCSLYVIAPDASQIASASCLSSTSYVNPVSLPTTGTYTIGIDPQGSTGSLTIILNNASDVTGTITPGGSAVTVTTTVPAQDARLIFNGTANQRVSLLVSSVTNANEDVVLLNPNGSTAALMEVFTGYTSFLDVQTLATTGTYTVWIHHISPSDGSQTLQLYNVPADVTGTITVAGTGIGVTTTVPGQNAVLTFSGTSGQHISVSVSSSTYAGSYSNPYYSCSLTLQNPDGSTALTNFCGQGAATIGSLTLGSTGTYTIVVNPLEATTGSVVVQVSN
jgi:YD repeat-containing protein